MCIRASAVSVDAQTQAIGSYRHYLRIEEAVNLVRPYHDNL